jgi:hypothetical protein
MELKKSALVIHIIELPTVALHEALLDDDQTDGSK